MAHETTTSDIRIGGLSQDEKDTVGYYERTSWRRPGEYWKPWIDKYATYLQPGSNVLEIGCGEAYPGDMLQAAGHTYFGTDITENFTHMAYERNPSLTILNNTADALPFAEDSLDGYLALNVFQHIERDHMPSVLAEARRVLRSGSTMFCTVAHFSADKPEEDRLMWEKRSLGMPSTRLFVFWDTETITQLFAEHGFSVLERNEIVTNTAGDSDADVHWHELTLRLDK